MGLVSLFLSFAKVEGDEDADTNEYGAKGYSNTC